MPAARKCQIFATNYPAKQANSACLVLTTPYFPIFLYPLFPFFEGRHAICNSTGTMIRGDQ